MEEDAGTDDEDHAAADDTDAQRARCRDLAKARLRMQVVWCKSRGCHGVLVNHEAEDNVWEVHWHEGGREGGGVTRETPRDVSTMYYAAGPHDELPATVRAWRRDYQHLHGVAGRERRAAETAKSARRQQREDEARAKGEAGAAAGASASSKRSRRRGETTREGATAAAARPRSPSPAGKKQELRVQKTPNFDMPDTGPQRKPRVVGGGGNLDHLQDERRDAARDDRRDVVLDERGRERVLGVGRGGGGRTYDKRPSSQATTHYSP